MSRPRRRAPASTSRTTASWRTRTTTTARTCAASSGQATTTSSCARLDRARELADGAGLTVERLREALSDHANGENAICRHGDEPKAVKTVFWCVADVTAGEITYGRGNPCDSEAQVYRF